MLGRLVRGKYLNNVVVVNDASFSGRESDEKNLPKCLPLQSVSFGALCSD